MSGRWLHRYVPHGYKKAASRSVDCCNNRKKKAWINELYRFRTFIECTVTILICAIHKSSIPCNRRSVFHSFAHFSQMAETLSNNLQVEISTRQILKIALPISLAILVPQVNFITNNIFLGNYSQHALAVASITGVYYLIFAMIGYGLNSGLQTLISRRAGENRPEEIGKIFGQGVFIALIIAATGIVLTWFVAPMILQQVLHSPDIAKDAINFLRI